MPDSTIYDGTNILTSQGTLVADVADLGVMVAIDAIIIDPSVVVRARVGEAAARYAELLADGTAFPPVELYYVDGALYLIDGRQRLEAARVNGHQAIRAFVEKGTPWCPPKPRRGPRRRPAPASRPRVEHLVQPSHRSPCRRQRPVCWRPPQSPPRAPGRSAPADAEVGGSPWPRRRCPWPWLRPGRT